MTFTQRLIGAARLDPATYEEVEHGRQRTMIQTLVVVALGSLATGASEIGVVKPSAVALIAALTFLFWLLWAAAVWLVGAKVLKEKDTHASLPEVIRVLGFAFGPVLLLWLTLVPVPVVKAFVPIIVGIWLVLTSVVAVRQGLDYHSTWRAVLVVAIGFAVWLVVRSVLAEYLGAAVNEGMIRSM
jgi:uncharacterized protein YacL